MEVWGFRWMTIRRTSESWWQSTLASGSLAGREVRRRAKWGERVCRECLVWKHNLRFKQIMKQNACKCNQNIGLAETFIWIFSYDVMEKLEVLANSIHVCALSHTDIRKQVHIHTRAAANLSTDAVSLLSHVPLFCNPMDCSPRGSSVRGISQVRILEWVAISFSRRSSWPRDRTCVSSIAGRFFTTEPPGKPYPQAPRRKSKRAD